MNLYSKEELEFYEEQSDMMEKSHAVNWIISKYTLSVANRVHDAIIANPQIDSTDIEDYLMGFLIDSSMKFFCGEKELSDMVSEFYQKNWNEKITLLKMKLENLPDNKENKVKRDVLELKISLLKNKLKGEKS